MAKNEGNVANAVDKIAEISKSHPDNIQLSLLHAKVLYSEGHIKEASQLLEAMSADKNTPMAYWNMLGKAYINLGERFYGNFIPRKWRFI